jgi:hypothetical protein
MAETRKQIEGKFDDIIKKINIDSSTGTDILTGLTENEKKTLCAEAHSLANNKFFNKLCDFYINQRILDLAISAKDMDEIFSERAKIVGVSELRNQILLLDNIHQADNQPVEKFNSKEVV